MRGSLGIFTIWFGCALASGHNDVNEDGNGVTYAENIAHLHDIKDIKSIPLYANLKELNIQPDSAGKYSLTDNAIPALPVDLDFQLLSVNAGMFKICIVFRVWNYPMSCIMIQK